MAGVKFLKMSWADITRKEVTSTVSNNDSLKDYLFSRNKFFRYESSGANNDTTTVSIEVDFTVSRPIDTLIVTKLNVKSFELFRWTGIAWVSVINVSNNLEPFYYGNFATINTTKVKLDLKATITPNQEKSLQDLFITQAIGQLEGYPEIEISHNKIMANKQMITGKKKVTKLGESKSIDLKFSDHVGVNDRALFSTLVEITEPFLIWPSAGDESQFEYPDIGYREDDIYLVNLSEGYKHSFKDNLYFSGFNSDLSFEEAA